MKRKKIFWILLPLLGILTAAVVVAIGVVREPEKALLKALSETADLQVRDVRFTEVGDSGIKWEVTAEKALYKKEDQLAIFEKIAAKVVMKDGTTYHMTGDKGTLKTDSRDLHIDGNVVIVSETGDRFTTRSLRYRNASRIIETDDPVEMESGSIRVNGVGMVFPLDENRISLLSKIRASSGQQ
jgi:LPS export ABC transporter protein LptC